MLILTFLAAFMLSGIAGYYSIIGLAFIFPAAFWPVVFMGGTLEFAKLVTASWLYRNWRISPGFLKSYLTFAVLLLMLITSMGIFGFLSKAHIEHSTNSAPIYDKVAVQQGKIDSWKERIAENKRVVAQMDDSIDQITNRSTSEKSILRSVQVRKSQQKERTRLTKENDAFQQEISNGLDALVPLQKSLYTVESEVGPIKYVAILIYGSSDKDVIEKAVRMVIMMIMLVFDPLAVLLLIAANVSLLRGSGKEPNKNIVEVFKNNITEPDIAIAPDSEAIHIIHNERK